MCVSRENKCRSKPISQNIKTTKTALTCWEWSQDLWGCWDVGPPWIWPLHVSYMLDLIGIWGVWRPGSKLLALCRVLLGLSKEFLQRGVTLYRWVRLLQARKWQSALPQCLNVGILQEKRKTNGCYSDVDEVLFLFPLQTRLTLSYVEGKRHKMSRPNFPAHFQEIISENSFIKSWTIMSMINQCNVVALFIVGRKSINHANQLMERFFWCRLIPWPDFGLDWNRQSHIVIVLVPSLLNQKIVYIILQNIK